MNLNKPIGGYLELELNDFGSVYHDNAVAVNSGRNALEYILLANNYQKIYIPYYTCDVMLQPLKRQNISFEFYYLNRDFTPKMGLLKKGEALLYVNYFGLFENIIPELFKKYSNIIVDNSQAFYSKRYKSIPTFYSPRKFFGLPDGGFIYPNQKIIKKLKCDKSGNRMGHLILRIDDSTEKGYQLFLENDKKIDYLPLRKMSKLTEKLLRNINFEEVRNRRNENFYFFHKLLKHSNKLSYLLEKSLINGPMIYPFLRENNLILREKLIKNKIFVATYWPNVIQWIGNEKVFEKTLVNDLIALPIDQRYGKKDLIKIVKLINSINE